MKLSTLSALTLAIGLGLASPAFAVDEYNTTNGLTLNGKPLGFHGVDTVALSSDKSIVSGSHKHAVIHDGVEYYFASSEAKGKFEADPQAYMPQFGGFCTLGVALGKKLDGDPRFADVRNGKLYVFVNETIFDKYKEDPAGTIAKAESSWTKIRSTAIEDL